jgi:hypothetical protein
VSTSEPSEAAPQPVAPLAGRRTAFRNLRRQLADDELAQTGTQKLLLELLERTDEECETLKDFRDRYHMETLRNAAFSERIRTVNAIEVAYGSGLALGAAAVGVAPVFWDHQPDGWICLIFGFLFMAAAIVVRVIKR